MTPIFQLSEAIGFLLNCDVTFDPSYSLHGSNASSMPDEEMQTSQEYASELQGTDDIF